jgi:hypothetical protein
MKTRFLKPGLQFATILFAVVGAFAFSQAPENDSVFTTEFGRLPNPQCTLTDVNCSVEETALPCKNSSNVTLRHFNGSSCPTQLYKIIP